MTEPLDPRLARYLQALPGALPPPSLGDRVLARHRRRGRRRLTAQLAALAASLSLLVAIPGGIGRIDPEPALTAVAPDPAALGEVRALDRQLQAGYARGVDPAKLDTLWLARDAALQRIDHPAAAAAQPVRL